MTGRKPSVNLTLRLDPELLEHLRQHADASGSSIAGQVVQFIRDGMRADLIEQIRNVLREELSLSRHASDFGPCDCGASPREPLYPYPGNLGR